MTQVVKVAKSGKNAFSEDPNDFIFHSNYNTFKIVATGTKEITLAASTNDQSFTQAHGLDWIPVIHAFAKRDSASQVFAPNGVDVDFYGVKVGFSGDVSFNYVESDDTNITFNFSNTKVTTVDVTIRYYVLERMS